MANFEITISPSSGQAGDVVEIDSSAEFNPQPTKNVVTFNGIIADILEGDESNLKVVVPHGATTGSVIVDTFFGITTSESITFTVAYDDEIFSKPEEEPYAKGLMGGRVKTRGQGSSNFGMPAYNKDFAYSKFIETHDENSIVQNVITIVLTEKGERLFEPEFGTEINKILFTPYNFEDPTFSAEILKEIKSAIDTYEPRATLIEEQSLVISEDTDRSVVQVILAIGIPTGNVVEIGLTLTSITNESIY